jgi:hypothetical protein
MVLKRNTLGNQRHNMPVSSEQDSSLDQVFSSANVKSEKKMLSEYFQSIGILTPQENQSAQPRASSINFVDNSNDDVETNETSEIYSEDSIEVHDSVEDSEYTDDVEYEDVMEDAHEYEEEEYYDTSHLDAFVELPHFKLDKKSSHFILELAREMKCRPEDVIATALEWYQYSLENKYNNE